MNGFKPAAAFDDGEFGYICPHNQQIILPLMAAVGAARYKNRFMHMDGMGVKQHENRVKHFRKKTPMLKDT